VCLGRVPSDLTVVGACSISAGKHAFATLKNNYAATNNLQMRTRRKTKACKQIVFKILKSPLSLLDRSAAPPSSAVMSQTYVGYVSKATVVVVFSIKSVASICFSNNAHLRHLVLIKRNYSKKTIPAGVNSRISL
jgi:CheY-like chemotaxis protein